MEKKKPIGLIIKELSKLKKISVVELSERLGFTRQSIYDTFTKRVSMSIDDLEKWAAALEIDVQVLIDKSAGKEVPVNTKSLDNGVFGGEVLQKIQDLLEDEIREKNNQLREQNEQIRALQEALKESQLMAKALLGKSHEYSPQSVAPWSSLPYKGVRQ